MSLKPNQMYLMPTPFGPSVSPRQGPDGRRFTYIDAPKNFVVRVSFLSNRDQLAALLPPGFRVAGEPIVTLSATYMKEIPWLAGRGYAMLGVTFPATYQGEQDKVTGDFLAVLWENMADPIITGREELGFAKVYCDLPDPVVYGGTTRCSASWEGFKFIDLEVSNRRQLSDEDIGKLFKARTSEGMLHYKYMPRTGDWGTPDVAYPTFTPTQAVTQRTTALWLGEGQVKFYAPRWEDMPTQAHIVNPLHDLELVEYRGAMIMESVGGFEGREQRILK